jgi:EAL domain-containing protein (putative c-di-GMP-specific phosphodiesterase class I)
VESQAVLDELERIGIDYAQGYFLARPEPIERLTL